MSSKAEVASDTLHPHRHTHMHEKAWPSFLCMPAYSWDCTSGQNLTHSPTHSCSPSLLMEERNQECRPKCKGKNHRLLGFSEAFHITCSRKGFTIVTPRSTLKTEISGSHPKVMIQEGWIGPGNLYFFKMPSSPTPGDPDALPRLGFRPIGKYFLEMDSQPLLHKAWGGGVHCLTSHLAWLRGAYG